jgi:hypothetical protein
VLGKWLISSQLDSSCRRCASAYPDGGSNSEVVLILRDNNRDLA